MVIAGAVTCPARSGRQKTAKPYTSPASAALWMMPVLFMEVHGFGVTVVIMRRRDDLMFAPNAEPSTRISKRPQTLVTYAWNDGDATLGGFRDDPDSFSG